MPDPATTTINQLPVAAAVSPRASTMVEEPDGPTSRIEIRKLLGRLISTDEATETEADLQALLDYPANSTALVYGDPDPAKQGWYRKVGASGAGNWMQFEVLFSSAAGKVDELVDQAHGQLTPLVEQAQAAAKTFSVVENAKYGFLVVDGADNVVMALRRDTGGLVALLDPASVDASGLTPRLLPAQLRAEPLDRLSGFLGVWVDAEDNIVGGFERDGGWLSRLSERTIFPQSLLDRIASGTVEGILPSPAISWIGDSITAYMGGQLGNVLDRDFSNFGFGSQTSVEIAARVGAPHRPVTLSVIGNQIAASGTTAVTAYNIDILYLSGVSGAGAVDGTLSGVHGTLTGTGGNGNRGSASYRFTRTEDGVAVPCAPGTRFIPDALALNATRTLICWLGRNNSGGTEDIIKDTLGIIAANTPRQKRVLVLSILNGGDLDATDPSGLETESGNGASIFTTNRKLALTFGPAFVDVRRYLVENGLADAGIAPTQGDLLDIANNVVPRSLRRDRIHPNDACIAVVIAFIARVINARGW